MFVQNGHSCTSCVMKNQCAFKGLSEKAMRDVDSTKRTQTYARGETIFHQGDDSSHFYCVSSGSVQVFRNSPYREQSFAIVGPGGWLGFRDALGSSPYQHNARVLKTTTVCKVPREKLVDLVKTDPAFAREISMELAAGWREAEKQSYNLGARNIMERLADFLLSLREAEVTGGHALGERSFRILDAEHKNPQGNFPEAELPLTREVIATLLGSSTESVIRALSDFKARGWIDTKKGKVVFRNEPALHRILVES